MVRYLGMIFLFIVQVFLLDVHVAAEFNNNDYYNYYNTNYSSYSTNVGQKRIFDDYVLLGLLVGFRFISFTFFLLLDGAFSLQFRARIPIDQLNSAISISIPFYAPFGGRSSRSSSVGQGRSFSGEAESTRLNLYREMESYVGQILRTDGHSCLLRAMCEVSANPGHEDGLMGKSGKGNFPSQEIGLFQFVSGGLSSIEKRPI